MTLSGPQMSKSSMWCNRTVPVFLHLYTHASICPRVNSYFSFGSSSVRIVSSLSRYCAAADCRPYRLPLTCQTISDFGTSRSSSCSSLLCIKSHSSYSSSHSSGGFIITGCPARSPWSVAIRNADVRSALHLGIPVLMEYTSNTFLDAANGVGQKLLGVSELFLSSFCPLRLKS